MELRWVILLDHLVSYVLVTMVTNYFNLSEK
jgi:hypothetical protein